MNESPTSIFLKVPSIVIFVPTVVMPVISTSSSMSTNPRRVDTPSTSRLGNTTSLSVKATPGRVTLPPVGN